MDPVSTRIPYRQTGSFSRIALDYIDQAPSLRQFFLHSPMLQGIQKAIEERNKFGTNRKVLVGELKKQYATHPSEAVHKNINALLSENTFTITTAHQNNIFTGPLYFIYKILHTIKLARHLEASFPGNSFVPVFYIGTEDADIDELNHIYLGGEKLLWNTKQKGAVGRMKIDKELVKLIGLMDGQLSVQPSGGEIISLLRDCYREGDTIADATFRFVHALFADLGLVVLLPDNAAYKMQMERIFSDDLLNQAASGIVENTALKLDEAGYKVQANPREINLFYLKDDMRERIVKVKTGFRVQNTKIEFTEEEMFNELKEHPERFSPNVILRGLFQETILPNLVFIGGGGETAYWLQLKDLFEHYKIPYPALVLRNSFLIVEKKWQEKIAKLDFHTEDFFMNERELLNKLVLRNSSNEIKLNGSLTALEGLYDSFKKQATAVDTTLSKHVDSLKTRTIHRLEELEKKMLRAEKRKFTEQQRQIEAIRQHLFPSGGLQERFDNFTYYYAKWGKGFIKMLFENSLALEQEFVLLEEK